MSEARQVRECWCPRGERPLGMLYNVNMGRGIVRLSTTKDCPEHDTCHGWTKAKRAGRPAWSDPYCPIHGGRNCPAPRTTPTPGPRS